MSWMMTVNSITTSSATCNVTCDTTRSCFGCSEYAEFNEAEDIYEYICIDNFYRVPDAKAVKKYFLQFRPGRERNIEKRYYKDQFIAHKAIVTAEKRRRKYLKTKFKRKVAR